MLCCMFQDRLNIFFYFAISSIITYHILELFLVNKHKNVYPVLIWKSHIVPEADRIITCYNNEYVCLISRNETYNVSTYLFYGSHLSNNEFPLPRDDKIWALFHEESPRNYAPILQKQIQNLFNITATFSRFSNFPLILQYLPNINLLTDKTYYIPIKKKNDLLSNLASVLYVQSDCDTPIDRDSYVSKLMKYMAIDSYGMCLHNKDFPSELSRIQSYDLYSPPYLHFIAQYKFIIAFENSICHDYITEKLWRPLIVGSIPIYLGSPSVNDWLPNSNSAILANKFKDPESLSNFIKMVNKNDVLYESFLLHKLESKIDNEILKQKMAQGKFGLDTEEEYAITAFECFVCREVHQKNIFVTRNVHIYDCIPPKDATWAGFWYIGRCQAKALDFLIQRNKRFSNSTYEKLWKEYYNKEDC